MIFVPIYNNNHLSFKIYEKKLITKSFERLLDKGLQRGFITYEELGKSLGKRNSTQENVEKAVFIIFDKKFL